ncbi:hypothetical protein BDA96_10G214000 [Sorghum bicolor]|uniref:DUF1685 domain-containing protein n=1 Tax=Sorghum bicolor TaxID=4558 RepID=A0A921Q4B6_SORBI|nr:hypothetical protein BDA96_10G214000 [Sorghum bicolor]KAG0514682.1 hypothetical protein BDA96_10G214000 [Sorghum bicolor]
MKRPQPQQAAPEAAEQTMALYDACWFHRLVLLPSPTPAEAAAGPPRPALPSQQPAPPLEREVADTHTPHAHQRPSSTSSPTAVGGLRHRRTRSDEATAAAFQGMEPLRLPDSGGNRARLETILSGKDGLVVAAPQPQPERRGRPAELARRPAAGLGRRRRRRGRSMSELEFEEVKGLQDLGFTFSDAEVDAELASIVPGLLRRKRSEEENSRSRATAAAPAAAATTTSSARRAAEAVNDDDDASAAPPRRPYLSEAWDDEEEEVRRALRNWRIPPAGDGNQLKEHLRMWAHTVASAVR